MSLVEHARRELAIVGEDDAWTVEGIISVVQAFADCGHSGGSAPSAIASLRHEPLSPLTDNPEGTGSTRVTHQRLSALAEPGATPARSQDAGRTYWMVHEADAAGG